MHSQQLTSHRAISFNSPHFDMLSAWFYAKDERAMPRNLQISEFCDFPNNNNNNNNNKRNDKSRHTFLLSVT